MLYKPQIHLAYKFKEVINTRLNSRYAQHRKMQTLEELKGVQQKKYIHL